MYGPSTNQNTVWEWPSPWQKLLYIFLVNKHASFARGSKNFQIWGSYWNLWTDLKLFTTIYHRFVTGSLSHVVTGINIVIFLVSHTCITAHEQHVCYYFCTIYTSSQEVITYIQLSVKCISLVKKPMCNMFVTFLCTLCHVILLCFWIVHLL